MRSHASSFCTIHDGHCPQAPPSADLLRRWHGAVTPLIIALSGLLPTSTYAAPVAHYPLNRNASELVGGRNGSLVGDAQFSNATPAANITFPTALGGGASLSLDGAFDKLVYSVPAGDVVSGSFTVAAWINPLERRTDGTLTFFGTRQPETHGFDVKIHVDRTIRIDVGDGNEWLAITDKEFGYELNSWYHFAVAVSPSSYSIYLNGQLFDSGALNGQPLLWDANHDIAIGAVGDVSHPHGEDFHGYIDDVWVFDEALSQDRVGAVMNRLLGDTDVDGDVDSDDLNNVRNNFGGGGLGDTDDDGLVKLADLNNVRNHFGTSLAGSNPVPEPSTLVLMVLVSSCALLALATFKNIFRSNFTQGDVMKASKMTCLAFFVAMLVTRSSFAEVLDQSHDFPPDQEGTVRSDIDRAQTFTVGAAGTLTRIELRLRRFSSLTTAPLHVDIRSTSSGVPDEANSPVLASTTVSAASIPLGSHANAPFTSIDVSAANLVVSPGDVFAIVLRSAHQFECMKQDAGGYSGGSEFIRSPVSPTWSVGTLDDDFAFRTFVEPVANQSPIADAGPDRTIECESPEGTLVFLDGTASSDPDNDELEYEWSAAEGSGVTFDDPTSATPQGLFPAGPTLVTLTVSDGNGGIDVDDVLITVLDSEPPVVICTTDEIALWPPNHQMAPVEVTVVASDECEIPEDLYLVCEVMSNEPDDANGDGEFDGDVDGLDGYTAPVPLELVYDPFTNSFTGTIMLRAERDGAQSSRVYSIVCEVRDSAGNTATSSCVVVVPHDRRKR